jgi:D-glycero-alpha-D-manno-heptose 1-phosphate guanylyltransferase
VDSPGVNEAIILAGGFGTRLRSLLPETPKPLAPVRGIPFLYYVLRWLEDQGIERVIACTGHLADQTERALSECGGKAEFAFLREESPLGTGGAIYRALREIRGSSAFVVNGDTYFPVDLRQFRADAESSGAVAAIALRRIEDASRYGSVEVRDGLIAGVREKGRSGPGLVNGGVYLLPRELTDRVPMPEVFSWETDFLEPKAAELRFAGVPIDAPFVDIGTPESYATAEEILPHLSI